MRRMWILAIAALGLTTAVEAATTRELVLFTVGVRGVPDEQFVVATDDEDLIERCRAELERPADIILGFSQGANLASCVCARAERSAAALCLPRAAAAHPTKQTNANIEYPK